MLLLLAALLVSFGVFFSGEPPLARERSGTSL
jgi:hypothetical protein